MPGLASFQQTQPDSSREGLLARFICHADCTVRDALTDLGFSKAASRSLAEAGRLRAADGGFTVCPGKSERILGTRLYAGQTVDVAASAFSTSPHACPAPPSLRVLYEDPFVVAVDKPAGVLVHGDGTGAPTLTRTVQAYLAACGVDAAPQAVQRLDVSTTGVVLFSKIPEFQCLFDALVASPAMEKRYLAVVRGTFCPQRADISYAMARDRHDARKMRAVPAGHGGGQRATTHVELLAVAREPKHVPPLCRSLVAARLDTGRKHQIRVHLAAWGHPVVNDALYGGVETRDGLMLHAYEERFVHPVTGRAVDICAGWPERFSRWFKPCDARSSESPSSDQRQSGGSHAGTR